MEGSHDLTPAAGALRPVEARTPVAVRVATRDDLPFIDALQKAHTKMVGYFPTAQFEGYLAQRAILVAHEPGDDAARLGYVISKDRYLKRDELGIIYQLNVTPGSRRKLVGATLLKEAFERSAYGCRLYCCWCAQDIEANRFWEAMGFVPIAFRAGSRGKGRVHIFWQRRIRAGDCSTPWWFPAKTDQGALRADRLVLPIPPGLHWSDPMPVLTPEEGEGGQGSEVSGQRPEVRGQLPDGSALASGSRPRRSNRRVPAPTPPPSGGGGGGGGGASVARVQFGPPGEAPPPPEAQASPQDATGAAGVAAAEAKPRRAKAPRKCDPALVAKARELRDRWMEAVAAGRLELTSDVGTGAPGGAKYDVTRRIAPGSTAEASAARRVGSEVVEPRRLVA